MQGIVDDCDFTAIDGPKDISGPCRDTPERHPRLDIESVLSMDGSSMAAWIFPPPYGTAVHAAKSGTVVLSQYGSSYGNYIVLAHGNGTRTMYAHMSARLVSPGQTVSQGHTTGRVRAGLLQMHRGQLFRSRHDNRALFFIAKSNLICVDIEFVIFIFFPCKEKA